MVLLRSGISPLATRSLRSPGGSKGGDMRSARRISMLLGKHGYGVKVSDRSDSGEFDLDTVFYREGYAIAGRKVAGIIGMGAVTRPLTWSTVYDIIIVTGGR